MPDAVRLPRGAVESDSVSALLRALLSEVRALRSDLRRSREASPPLVAALEAFFGNGRFTTSGVLSLADDEPHGAIAVALADVIDLNASPRSRATQLGVLLGRMPGVEVVAEQRGCAVYRLRT